MNNEQIREEEIFESVLQELERNNTETQYVDTFNKLIRQKLKEHTFEFNVGNYYFNISPQNLFVKYETADTYIEISKDDVCKETEREVETRYFLIKKKENSKGEYSLTVPVIRINGSVLNIDGIYSANYILELISKNDKYDIKDYLEDKEGLKILDNITATLSLRINKDDSLIDFSDYLKMDKVLPVYLSYFDECFKIRNENDFFGKTYNTYLPDMSSKFEVLKMLYRSIIEFYSKYM